MMMYVDDDDEYGLEAFFPAHVEDSTRVSRGNSSHGTTKAPHRTGSGLAPSPPQLSGFAVRKQPPLALSSNEVKGPIPPPASRDRGASATAQQKRSLPLPSTAASASARAFSSSAVSSGARTNQYAARAKSKGSSHSSAADPITRASSRSMNRLRESLTSNEYSGYFAALEMYGNGFMETSVNGASYGSISGHDYLYLPSRPSPTRAQSEQELLGAGSASPGTAAGAAAPVPRKREEEAITALTPPRLNNPKTNNVSSFFSRSAAVGGDHSSDDDVTNDSDSRGSSPQRRGEAISGFDGASIFGNRRSSGPSARGNRNDEDEDDIVVDDESADPDFFSHAAKSQQKRNLLQRAPNLPNRTRHTPVSGYVPEKNSRGSRTTPKSVRPHGVNPRKDAHAVGSHTTEGPPKLLATVGSTGETFFTGGAGRGMASGRSSALESTLTSMSDDLDSVADPVVHQRCAVGGGHQSVTRDAHLMSVLRLTGTREGGPAHITHASSDDEDEGDVDEEADEESERDEVVMHTGGKSNHSAPQSRGRHNSRSQGERTPELNKYASVGHAPHRQAARPGAEQRIRYSPGQTTTLPPVSTSSGSSEHVTHRHRARAASSVHPPTSQITAPHMGGKESATVPPRGHARSLTVVPPQRSVGAGAAVPRRPLGGLSLQPQHFTSVGVHSNVDGVSSPVVMGSPMWATSPGYPGCAVFSPRLDTMGHPSPRAPLEQPQMPQPPHRQPSHVLFPQRISTQSLSVTPAQRSQGCRAHSVASSVVSSLPSLHASDRFDAVADLRQLRHRQNNGAGVEIDMGLTSPPVEDLDIVLTHSPNTLERPSAVAPASMFRNVGDEWFSGVAAIISWVPSPHLTPDSRPLL